MIDGFCCLTRPLHSGSQTCRSDMPQEVMGARTVIAQEHHEEDFDLSSGSSKMSVYQNEGEVMLLLIELGYIP